MTQLIASEHVRSYYAATANPDPRYLRLEGESRADVVVVGGGLRGDSARFDLFARIRYRRISGGKWLANPAFALGMLYFRIRERL